MAKFCTSCGEELNPDARFCTKCGAFVGPGPDLQQQSYTQPEQQSYTGTQPTQQNYTGSYTLPVRQSYIAANTPPVKSGSGSTVICIVLAAVLLMQTLAVMLFGWPGFAVRNRKDRLSERPGQTYVECAAAEGCCRQLL